MFAVATRRHQDLRKALRDTAPRIPLADAEPVLDRAARLTRRGLPASIALWQALASHVRHVHTDYDALLAEGYDRDAARFFVVEAMEERLRLWGCTRTLETEDEEAGDA